MKSFDHLFTAQHAEQSDQCHHRRRGGFNTEGAVDDADQSTDREREEVRFHAWNEVQDAAWIDRS